MGDEHPHAEDPAPVATLVQQTPIALDYHKPVAQRSLFLTCFDLCCGAFIFFIRFVIGLIMFIASTIGLIAQARKGFSTDSAAMGVLCIVLAIFGLRILLSSIWNARDYFEWVLDRSRREEIEP